MSYINRKDYIDDLISKGAFVLPPKKAPAGASVVAEPESVLDIASTPVENAAEQSKHWKESIKPDPETPTKYSAEDRLPTLGETLDLIVVAWSFQDPTGKNRGGQGLARQQGPRKKGARDGYLFKEADILSDGIDSLRPGSRIRGRLAEAISSSHPFRIIDIEIYES